MEEWSLRLKMRLRNSRMKGPLRGLHQALGQVRTRTYRLAHPSTRTDVRIPNHPYTLMAQLEEQGLPVRLLRVDPDAFEAYLAAAKVPEEVYAGIYRGKMLEHFLSVEELAPTANDVIVDIACHGSPFTDTVRRLYHCVSYRQDLLFPPGIHDDRIGGDAGNMPLAAGSVSGMTLHNSLEHFEGDSDSAFIREAARVLRPGGRVCVVPLDLSERYLIRTDPSLRRPGVTFDEDALLVEIPGLGQRHERFYDFAALRRRVLAQSPLLRPSFALVENAAELCAMRQPIFLLTLTRIESASQ